MLEKTPESPLDCKQIKPVNPEGNQPWIFIGRTAAEAPVLWPPDAKSQLIGKDPGAGKDWGQKGMTEDEMVGWHHRLNGRGFGWTPGVGDGPGGLACWGSWGRKESGTTERLNWTEQPRRLCLPEQPRLLTEEGSFYRIATALTHHYHQPGLNSCQSQAWSHWSLFLLVPGKDFSFTGRLPLRLREIGNLTITEWIGPW